MYMGPHIGYIYYIDEPGAFIFGRIWLIRIAHPNII